MNFFDRLFMATLAGKKDLHWGAGAAVAVFFALCSVEIIIYGFSSGYLEWALVGALCALIFSIAAAVLIIINISKNSNRW